MGNENDMSETKKAEGRVLLPSCVSPLRYELELRPDLTTFVLDGDMTVTCAVSRPGTDRFTVHSKELSISSVSFTDSDGTVHPAVEINFNLKLTTVEFVFGGVLSVGEGKLSVVFQGCLNNQMAGFYRSSYKSVEGETRTMASTQFESLDARRCFPCWDEPSAKATFLCSLVIPNDRCALSNMPEVESTELAGGLRRVRFDETPRMSTYLLAFCVGEFDFVQAFTKSGVAVRVYTPPGKSGEGRFALADAVKSLDFYDDFFGIRYPLPKMDMIAIPEFAMGAMENWGLVTYREVDVLIDDLKASSQQKQRVCTVVTHELAHQWFGNLVTMAWWDDLWLNEGFANWCENFAADYCHPDYKMWEQFTIDAQTHALRLDSLRTSHPIQVSIKHAEEVEEVFDAISYCKGGSVVRMLYALLGPGDFQRGLKLYFDRHKYGNTETFDLWSAWSEVSGKDINGIMSGWTDQMGHPLVTVKSCAWSAGKATLELEQQWFLSDGSAVTADEAKLWTIPLIVGSPATPAAIDGDVSGLVQLMSGASTTIEVPLASEGDWVKLNFGQHALMRVLYTPDMLQRLAGAVASKTLPPEDRAALIGDAYALAKADKLAVSEVIRLLLAYREEDQYTVWDAIETTVKGLNTLLRDDEAIHGPFKRAMAQLVRGPFEAVGWDERDDDGHLGKMLRATLIRLKASFSEDDAAFAEEARRRFDAACAGDADPSVLPAEYKVPVFRTVLREGGDTEYEQLIALLDTLDSNAERKHIYHSLGAASTLALKRRTLDWTTSGAVKLQDFFYPMLSVSNSGKAGLELAWSYLQENFDRIKAMLASASPSLMDAVIAFCCGGFCSHARADEIEAFFKANPMPSNQRKLSQLLENMRINAAFLDRIRETELAAPAFWEGLAL